MEGTTLSGPVEDFYAKGPLGSKTEDCLEGRVHEEGFHLGAGRVEGPPKEGCRLGLWRKN